MSRVISSKARQPLGRRSGNLAECPSEKALLGETKVNGAKARSSGGDKPPLCRKQR